MAHWANETYYFKRRVQINFDYRIKVIKLWIAGKLLRLAFRIDPYLQKSYNEIIVDEFIDRSYNDEIWF